MRVFVALEGHFLKRDGTYFTTTTFTYDFFKRYLDVFPKVTVVARVKNVGETEENIPVASGPGVDFYELPDYRGPYELAFKFDLLRRKLRALSMRRGAFVLRIPGIIGSVLGGYLVRQNRPYALEVVGDPEDAFMPKAAGYPLISPIAGKIETNSMKKLIFNAPLISYVTENSLQMKYPPREGAYITWYSSVELPDEIFDIPVNLEKFREKRKKLILVGSLNHNQKGVDILLQATCILLRRGHDVEVEIAGDGRRRAEFERLKDKLGLGERVHFLGYIKSGMPVFRKLMEAHLFVLPSRQEGLPRSLIEAMAVGLPAVATRVGGIPELLRDDFIVEPENPEALALKIEELILNPERMKEIAISNREKASKYRRSILRERRRQFYLKLWEISYGGKG